MGQLIPLPPRASTPTRGDDARDQFSVPLASQRPIPEATMLNAYRASLAAAGLSQGTIAQRVRHIEQLATHHDLLAVTETDLINWLAARRDTHSAEARKSMRSSFRRFYKWAHKNGLIEHDPSIDLEPVRVPKTVARIAPDSDIQAALITADLHTSAMILLARYACLRLSEITTLHTRHRVGDILTITGKGGKQRYVPANDALLAVLLQLESEQGRGYYFPGVGANPYLHYTTVERKIQRATGWNPHSLRHAGATAAYEATGDLRAVQEFLGHASLATTERYLHTSLDKIRRVAAGTTFREEYVWPHRVRSAA